MPPASPHRPLRSGRSAPCWRPPPPTRSRRARGPRPRYRTWLEEVAPLISAEGAGGVPGAPARTTSATPSSAASGRCAIPFPQTPRNELRERWEERVEVARERFGNLAGRPRPHDPAQRRARGRPARPAARSCCRWRSGATRARDRIRGDFTLAFVSRSGSQGPYRLWYPSDGLELAALARSCGCRSTTRRAASQAIAELCPRGEDIAARLGEALDWQQLEETVAARPEARRGVALRPSPPRSTDVPEGAADLPGPGRPLLPRPLRQPHRGAGAGQRAARRGQARAARGQPRGLLQLPGRRRGALQGRALRALPLPLHPARGRGRRRTQIPLVFQRYLRPGSYSLVLKIEDTGGQALLPRAAGAGGARRWTRRRGRSGTPPAAPAAPAPAPRLPRRPRWPRPTPAHRLRTSRRSASCRRPRG